MLKRLILTLLVALAAAAPAYAVPGDYHRGLGDDTLASEGRDVPGDLKALRFYYPFASPEQRGCTTHLIGTNFSSRGGANVDLLVAHYTVSSNQAGWGDVNAIRNWFNQSRAQASSNYIIDFEGNCKLIVAESAKAWTQGAYNPYSVSIEFIATGKESRAAWRSSAGLRKGARVFADAAKRHNIPLRWVNPSGCDRPRGITDHNYLECGNTHTDVRPNFPYSRFMDLVREFSSPPEKRFVLKTGEGKTLGRSSPYTASNAAAESRRFERFLNAHRSTMLQELRRDNDFRVRRVRAN